MKTKKVPPKRLSAPAEPVAELIKILANSSIEDMVTTIEQFNDWIWPKADFFHWITVLNRFDSLLETICGEYNLKSPQIEPFTADAKRQVMAVLKFTLILWDNCSNRNLYGSYEHLLSLLQTNDIDVLQLVLRLLLRPAGRITIQRPLRGNLSVFQSSLTVLAQHFGISPHSVDLSHLVAPDATVPEEWLSVVFKFYQSSAEAGGPSPATTPKNSGERHKSGKASKLTVKTEVSRTFSVAKYAADDVVCFTIDNPALSGKQYYKVYGEIAPQVPAAKQFDLFHRLRIATWLADNQKRAALVQIRLLAISVLSSIVGEDVIKSKILVYEPDLVTQMAHLLAVNVKIPLDIQVAAICALESMSHYRNGLPNVLTALNVSANHGILMYVLRKVVSELEDEESSFTGEFVDAFFSFVSFLIDTDTGGMALISGGFIQTLVPVLSNHKPEHTKQVTKCIGMLDNIVNRFTNSINPFANANGLDILVGRIREEVELVMALPESAESSSVSHEKLQFTRAMLKFILHLMQIAGSADHIRNLIETSLPKSLDSIFKRANTFGAGVFGIAIGILSTFIHNEPTCLSILQDAGLPSSLLKTCQTSYPVSAEIISALPNAFGAMCLNAQGLQMFQEQSPIRNYLMLFASPAGLKHLADNEVPSIIGGNVDELIRHHPSLKEGVLLQVIQLFDHICGISGDYFVEKETKFYASDKQVSLPEPPQQKDAVVEIEVSEVSTGLETRAGSEMDLDAVSSAEEKEPETVLSTFLSFVDICSRFAESLFQNASHAKEFIKLDGLKSLFQLSTLPILPVNFLTTPAAVSLGYLFRVLIEVQNSAVVEGAVSGISKCFDSMKSIVGDGKLESLCTQLLAEPESEKSNKFLRALIDTTVYTGLFCDLFYAHCGSQSKSLAAVCSTFTSASGSRSLKILGILHRFTTWELLDLEVNFKDLWFDRAKTDDEAEKAATKTALYQNVHMLKTLLKKQNATLTPTFHGIVRSLCTRRSQEASQRESINTILSDLCEVFGGHLSWNHVKEAECLHKWSYYDVFLNFLGTLMVDDRLKRKQLQLIFVLALQKHGVMDRIVELYSTFFTEFCSLKDLNAENMQFRRLSTGLTVFTEIARLLTNVTLLNESSSYERLVDYNQPFQLVRPKPEDFDFFESDTYIAQMIILFGTPLKKLWNDSILLNLTPELLKTLLSAILTILTPSIHRPSSDKLSANALGSDSSRESRRFLESAAARSAITSRPRPSGSHTGQAYENELFSRLAVFENAMSSLLTQSRGSSSSSSRPIAAAAPVVPDSNMVAMLEEMGFAKNAAERALIETNNNSEQAVDYILAHPEILESSAADTAASVEVGSGAASDAVATSGTQNEVVAVIEDTEVPDSAAMEVATTGEDGADGSGDMPMSIEDAANSLVQAITMSLTGNPAATVKDKKKKAFGQEDEGKLKEKEEAYKTLVEQVDAIRSELVDSLLERSLLLLDKSDELMFSVSELCKFVAEKDVEKAVVPIMANLQSIVNGMAEVDARDRNLEQLSKRFRLLALLANDTKLQAKFVRAYQPFVFDVLDKILTSDVDTLLESKYRPVWVSCALLVIESYISVADEPLPETLKFAVDGRSLEPVNVSDKIQGLEAGQLLKLLTRCLKFLGAEDIGSDWAEASMRLLVRLTRNGELALQLVQENGLEVLFLPQWIGKYPTHQELTVLILRHIMEDKLTLQRVMEHRIGDYFPKRTMKYDVSTFLMNLASLACREPKVFIKAVESTCELCSYEKGKSSLITLKSVSDSEKKSIQDTENKSIQDIEKKNESRVEEAPLKTTGEGMKNVIQFLVTKISKLASFVNHLPADSSKSSLDENKMEVSSQSSTEIGPESIDEKMLSKAVDAEDSLESKEAVFNHVQHVFAMQCLSELVLAFPESRNDLVECCHTLFRRKSSGLFFQKSKGKDNWFLVHLLMDVLPYNNVELAANSSKGTLETKPLDRRLQLESSWAISLLTSLCSGVDSWDTEKERYPELTVIRKNVFEHIVRAMKNALDVNEPRNRRYGRYLALVDLTQNIFNSFRKFTARNAESEKVMSEYQLQCAKLMFEKGFAPPLAAIAYDVDPQHPCAKVLIENVVQCLHGLSVQMEKLGEEQSTLGSIVSEEVDVLSASDADDNDAIYDLTRNSALGVFHAQHSDHHSSSEVDEDDVDIDDDLDEDDDEVDGEEVESSRDLDESDDSHTDDSADDMEIVVPNSFHNSSAISSSSNDSLDDSDSDEDLSTEEDGYSDEDDESDEEDEDEDHEDENGDDDSIEEVSTFSNESGESRHVNDAETYLNNSTLFPLTAEDGQSNAVVRNTEVNGAPGIITDASEIENSQFRGSGRRVGNTLSSLIRGSQIDDDEEDDYADFVDEMEGNNDDDDFLDGDDYEVWDDPLFGGDTSSWDRIGGGSGLLRRNGRPRTQGRSRLSQPYVISFGTEGTSINPRSYSANDGPDSFFDDDFFRINSRAAMPFGIPSSREAPVSVGLPSLLSENAASNTSNLIFDSTPTDMWQPLANAAPANASASGESRNGQTLGMLLQQLRQLAPGSSSGGSGPMALLEEIFSRTTVTSVRRVGDHFEVVASDVAPAAGEVSASTPNGAASSQSPLDQQVATLSKFKTLSSDQRFLEEAQFMYGKSYKVKAMVIIDELYNTMIPLYIKAKKESEERAEAERKAEDEKRKKEEEEKKQKQALEQTENSQQTTEAAERSSVVEPPMSTEPTAASAPEKKRVTVNGREYDITGTNIDPTFLEALPDDMKEEVIQDELQRLAQSQPMSLTGNNEDIDANVRTFVSVLDEPELRESAMLDLGVGRHSRPNGIPEDAEKPKTKKVHANAVKLVNRTSLLMLLKLVFIPEGIRRTGGLYSLLRSLSQNSETRAELITSLVAVLTEAKDDMTPVSRSALLAMQASGSGGPSTPKSASKKSKGGFPLTVANAGFFTATIDAVPLLVQQRSLEALHNLVSKSDVNAIFCLQESEQFLSLLQQLSSNPSSSSSKKGKAKLSLHTKTSPLAVFLGLLDRNEFQANIPLLESLGFLLSCVFKQLVRLAERATNHLALLNKQNPQPAKTLGDLPLALQPPNIPDTAFRSVVRILSLDECSNKAFAYSLVMIQSLCSLSNGRELVTKELIEQAKQLGNELIEPLKGLTELLTVASSAVDVHGETFSLFSSENARQAKVLRLLKAIDFIENPKNTKPVFPGVTKLSSDDSWRRIAELYNSSNLTSAFVPLWQALGASLSAINLKENLIPIATVLLPLIESFLVVSKPFVHVPAQSPAMHDLFSQFTEAHRKILNHMVRNTPSLMSGSFALLVQNPKVLEFDTKRTYFQQTLHKKAARPVMLHIGVHRDNVFQESFNQVERISDENLKNGKLSIKFKNEEGVDAGGVTREWFSVLSRAMFNPDYAMFKPSVGDKVTYQPNRLSSIHSAHLQFFEFVGRIIAKAVYEGYLLDCYFTRSFYKHILGVPVVYKDMEAVDPDYYKSLEWMLENDISGVFDLTFSVEMDTLGRKETKDLKPNGRNVSVTEANKAEYVQLITKHHLTDTIEAQLQAFLRGFYAIVPKDLVSIFNEQELELLISGLPEIDIDDWKNNTDYHNYSSSSPQVQWFWRAVRSFTQEERAKLLQFVTGTSKVPLNGFSQLQGVNGVTKFNIHRDFKTSNRLPSSHTCFNQLDLPLYETYELLRTNLLVAISECSGGFGFA